MKTREELAATEGTVKRLHVDKQRVRQHLPAVTIQTSKGSIKASAVQINGPSTLIHRPDDPLSCGARLWIETLAPVEVIE